MKRTTQTRKTTLKKLPFVFVYSFITGMNQTPKLDVNMSCFHLILASVSNKRNKVKCADLLTEFGGRRIVFPLLVGPTKRLPAGDRSASDFTCR